jgi:heme a synthase
MHLKGSLITPFNRAHHSFAVLAAFATFLLIIAGALVTSNDAGVSVSDWPTSFGHIAKMPRMVGGVQYEHRMIAEFIGTLTIITAAWTWRTDRRWWMKKLGIAALGTVVLQGILGGITVLELLPPTVSTAHAVVGQTFFCIAVALALFTGRRFAQEEPRTVRDSRKPSLIALTNLSVLIVYIQLALGGMFRHRGMSWEPHVINTALVTFILIWTSVRVLSYYSEIEGLRRPAILVLSLVIVQLCLGFLSFLTKVVWGAQAVQPTPLMVPSTVAHTAVGALLLASTVVLAIQARRHLAVLDEHAVRTSTPRPVTA